MNAQGQFTLAALLSLLIAASPAEGAPGRNVVLVVADDQGPDAGCYGNRVLRTPHLDRLAAEGTRFDLAFCAAASCSPSRSTILTGLQNHSNGQFGLQHAYHNFHTRRSVKALPALLSEAGYRTARIGKLHVQPEDVYRFDTVIPANPRNPVAMAGACRAFIEDSSEKPFFLYFCPADPHRSGTAGEAPHRPDRFGNEAVHPGVREERYDPAEVIVPPFLPDSPACRAELAEYYQSVSRADQGLGKLVEVLRETGRYESTLIIYLSDNGVPFPGAKTTLYEPGMRLPLVARSPLSKRRGLVSSALVSWTDLVPTILEYAAVKPEGARFHGRSFLGVLEEEKPEGWDRVFGSHTFHEVTMYYPMRCVRERRYKYILNLAHGLPYPFASDLYQSATWQAALKESDKLYGKRTVEAYTHRPRHELYDLEADPHEVRNLAGDPAHQQVLEDLKAKLEAFQRETGDPWVLKYSHE